MQIRNIIEPVLRLQKVFQNENFHQKSGRMYIKQPDPLKFFENSVHD